jgi:hypothetical protein
MREREPVLELRIGGEAGPRAGGQRGARRRRYAWCARIPHDHQRVDAPDDLDRSADVPEPSSSAKFLTWPDRTSSLQRKASAIRRARRDTRSEAGEFGPVPACSSLHAP